MQVEHVEHFILFYLAVLNIILHKNGICGNHEVMSNLWLDQLDRRSTTAAWKMKLT